MKKISLFVLALSLVAMLAACGSEAAPAPPATNPPATSPPAPMATAADADAEAPAGEPGEAQVIEVTMHTTGYNPTEVKVKAGSQVRFNLTNTDTEEHDLFNRQAKINMGASAKSDKTYDWVAPEKVGTYVAECTLHEGLKMTVIVE